MKQLNDEQLKQVSGGKSIGELVTEKGENERVICRASGGQTQPMEVSEESSLGEQSQPRNKPIFSIIDG